MDTTIGDSFIWQQARGQLTPLHNIIVVHLLHESNFSQYSCFSRTFAPIAPNQRPLHFDFWKCIFLTLEPVVIVEQPQSISVTVGSSAHLSCKAKGFPTPSYQWFKVGHGEIDTGFEMNFVLDNVSLTDGGEYYCQVMNDINSVSSNVVTIQVIPRGKLIKAPSYLFKFLCRWYMFYGPRSSPLSWNSLLFVCRHS